MPRKSPTDTPEHNNPTAVDEVVAQLDEPRQALVNALRPLILSVDPQITEGVKWNSASFYHNGWFATFNARTKIGITLVLHHGVTARPDSDIKTKLKTRANFLTWHSLDRASLLIKSPDQLKELQADLKAIIKAWSKHVASLES